MVVWELVPSMISEITYSQSRDAIGGKEINVMRKKVSQMSVGVSHAAFLTMDGEVYCLGSNRCGECGADPSTHGVATACRRVKFPKHCNPIVRVECGRSHTVAVGAEGQCLAWGDDSKIQLGLGDTRSNVGEERPFSGSRGFLNFRQGGEAMATPAALRGSDGQGHSRAKSTSEKKYGEFDPHFQWRPIGMSKIPLEYERQVHGIPYPPPVNVACGHDFTVLMVRDSPDFYPPEEESHRLFCCGENARGQCGRSLQQQQQSFAACKLPRNSATLGLSCGAEHCLAMVQKVGANRREVWSWGSNRNGQAGGTNSACVCPAGRLRLSKDLQIEAVCCDFQSSAVICSTNGKVEAPKKT
eukprot:TRINITY_DN93963_c0_g1_i1.p1 TRINITY_DN93963_c0_g1~~TRINITY_DN93963_c0_g1_i1.p1  ORF type:complete len:417 (+),score=58.19 TRINITY_DN93963_c0_g1_i1:185-1252(+)